MSLARHGVHLLKARKRALRRQYLADISAGLRKGPLTLLHESGKPHDPLKCPDCTQRINEANAKPFVW